MTGQPARETALDRLHHFSDELNAARDAAYNAVGATRSTSDSTTRRAVATAYSHLADVYERVSADVCTFPGGDLLSTVLIDAESGAKQDARDWNELADTAAAREAADDTKPKTDNAS